EEVVDGGLVLVRRGGSRREEAGDEVDAGRRRDVEAKALAVHGIARVEEPRRRRREEGAGALRGDVDLVDGARRVGEREAIAEAAALLRTGGEAPDRRGRVIGGGGRGLLGDLAGDAAGRAFDLAHEAVGALVDLEGGAAVRGDQRGDRELARAIAGRDLVVEE